jgi:hypothetical protein
MSKEPNNRTRLDKGNTSQDEDEEANLQEFDYVLWLAELHLSEDGARKVEKACLQDECTITCVSEADIVQMKLQVGDHIRVRNGVKKMRQKFENPPPLDDTAQRIPVTTPVAPSPPVTTDQQYSLSEVLAILHKGPTYVPTEKPPPRVAASNTTTGGLACLGPRPRRESTSDRHEITSSYLHDLLVLGDCNQAANRGEKALLPVNFTSNLRGTLPDTEEIMGYGHGTRLVLRTATRRVTPDRLTQGQYFAANARIMAKLATKMTQEELFEYFDFLRQIGDLLQVFTCASVFVLDNEHRLEVAETGRRWNEINPTTQIALLKHREEAANRQNSNRGGAAQATNNTTRGAGGPGNPPRNPSQRICTAYNTEAGCKYGTTCIFRHVCSVTDCQKSHPAFRHNSAGFETPPRWQGDKNPQDKKQQ